MIGSVAFAEYPKQDITIIVGYAAGGGTDVMARTVAPYLEKYLGNKAHVVIKNVPGAGGQIGFTQTAQATPNGYTLGTFNLPGAVTLMFDRKAAYSVDSLIYLANLVDDPNTLLVKKGSSLKSIKDIVAAEKKDPGSVTVALSALGGNGHLGTVEFATVAGLKFSYVPFNGAAPARAAVMGGHVMVGTQTQSEAESFKDEFSVLAVLSQERSSLAPGIPTLKELGYDVEMGSLRGFVGPAGIPSEITKKLISAFTATYNDPEFQAVMTKGGNPLRFIAGEAFAKVSRKQTDSVRKIWETTPWK